MEKQLKHLVSQLNMQGIASPESFVSDKLEELPEKHWNSISGGFGQVF
jgi:hypothetical protein